MAEGGGGMRDAYCITGKKRTLQKRKGGRRKKCASGSLGGSDEGPEIATGKGKKGDALAITFETVEERMLRRCDGSNGGSGGICRPQSSRWPELHQKGESRSLFFAGGCAGLSRKRMKARKLQTIGPSSPPLE